ncbi:MAG: hypothetical protein HGA37_09105 [Lentimicrobium sp.]|nr:hypothetical protein [Lentimicrobium sp.]
MKHIILRFGILICLLISFNSCDPLNQIDGLVIDENTSEPIDSVLVYVKFKDHVLDSFSYIQDSLTKTQRAALIKKYSNDAKWIDAGGDKMFRYIPTLTESDGRFDISFPVGFFPHYKLYLEKPGYETFEIRNKRINWDERPKVFRMTRKSGL